MFGIWWGMAKSPTLLADRVLKALGGPSQAARVLKLPVSTVHSWKTNNGIPRWRWPEIHRAARRLSVALPNGVPPAEEAA